ncbi:MAG TPA: YrzE family protein [Gaiellaceae bacterium]|nr:YrzE family protein [Gaiellaceae bacterium]
MAQATRTVPEDTRVEERVDQDHAIEREAEPRTTAEPYSGVAAARDRFGGLDIPAGLVGALTALASVGILTTLVGAVIGTIGSPDNLTRDTQELPIWSLAAGVGVLFVAYLIGGWVAGRMARYDGARNGFTTGIWTLLFVAALAGLSAWIGAEYNGLFHLTRPDWWSWDALTWEALIAIGAGILAVFVGGTIGGMWGEHYHRRADRTVVATPPTTDETA